MEIQQSNGAKLVRNVLLKATLLFILFNAIYYVVQPLKGLNRLTVYNTLVPGRVRLPFSEYPADSYNLIMPDLDQMLASHEIARPKADDEYRVIMIGDSSVWGYLLDPTQTQAACLNRLNPTTSDGRKVRVYNLGYPTLSVMKDLLILRHALPYKPDLIVWSTTLASLYPSDQLDFEVVHADYDEVAALVDQYKFKLYQWPVSPPTWVDRTLIGQRRALADWLRYQLYGLGWAATGIDHQIPKFVTPHADTLQPDDGLLTVNLMHLTTPGKISAEDLSLDIVKAGIQTAHDQGILTLLINEPTYHSTTSEIRVNSYYPKWAYNSYRDALRDTATREGWHYADLWDSVPVDQFTDTDFHLTPAASCTFAATLRDPLLALATSSR
ncbi:MAG: hypothetical protein ABI947_15980 [Chloroflexota bacterium]